MGAKRLTSEEIKQIISLKEQGFNTVQISEMIGRHQTSIERNLKKLGFTDFGKTQVSKDDVKWIKLLYTEGLYQSSDIHKKYYVDTFCSAYIERVIRENGFSRGKNINRFINHSYFDNIDNPNKAYLLGNIMADASVSNGKTLRMEVSEKDVELLEYAISEISPTNNILKSHREDRHGIDTNYINISSTYMVRSLEKYGVVKRKTYKDIGLPNNIHVKYMRDYIRGYFDGDGTIWKTNKSIPRPQVSFCVTKTFGEDLESFLKSEGIITKDSNNLIDMSKYGTNIYHLRITRLKDVESFYNYIYYDKNLFCLKRKRDKFEKWL